MTALHTIHHKLKTTEVLKVELRFLKSLPLHACRLINQCFWILRRSMYIFGH